MSYYKKLTATDLIKISGFVPRNRILWKMKLMKNIVMMN